MTENDSEFGHKSWPTVPGEKTLEKIRELVEAPIWVINYNYSYDSGHYSPDWEERLEEHHGFFRSEEAAQAFVDKLNDHTAKYEKYLANCMTANRRREAEYEGRMDKWNTLRSNGLDPADYMVEPKLDLTEVKSIDEMRLAFEREEYFSVTKLEFNRG